jgi:hypothetical protein
MAVENWSPPISKTFEQIVYFSTSVTGYQTKKSVACTINVYNRRFYDRKLRFSLERNLRSYSRNPSYG